MFADLAWAMGQPGGEAGGQQGLASFLPLIIIFGILYFLLIRPQQQKQKRQKEMVDNLKRGDKVVTLGGIYGTITSVQTNFFTLNIAEGTEIKIRKQAVSFIQGQVMDED